MTSEQTQSDITIVLVWRWWCFYDILAFFVLGKHVCKIQSWLFGVLLHFIVINNKTKLTLFTNWFCIVRNMFLLKFNLNGVWNFIWYMDCVWDKDCIIFILVRDQLHLASMFLVGIENQDGCTYLFWCYLKKQNSKRNILNSFIKLNDKK